MDEVPCSRCCPEWGFSQALHPWAAGWHWAGGASSGLILPGCSALPELGLRRQQRCPYFSLGKQNTSLGARHTPVSMPAPPALPEEYLKCISVQYIFSQGPYICLESCSSGLPKASHPAEALGKDRSSASREF